MQNDQIDFTKKAYEMDRLITEAKVQFEMDDHTRLPQPVHYRILWLGYTHVTYEKLDFQMVNLDRDYLRSVVINFKAVVENYSDHNVEIEIDLDFIDAPTSLTKCDNFLYLSSETIQDTINQYDSRKKYDTVITTVQTKGDENQKRNKQDPQFGKLDVILGLKTHGIEHQMGYSTFNLFEIKKSGFPLKNPSVPSLYATAVAIHEWLHQIEYLGELLEIEFPPTHGYQGSKKYPGYQEIIRDKNNYDFCEYYESILRGTCQFKSPDTGYVRNVGMYPKMWRLISRDALNIGVYNIRNIADNCYLTGKEKEKKLTKSKKVFNWIFRYGGNFTFILIPLKFQNLRIDLDNGWDIDGTTVKLYTKTSISYRNAQRWLLTKNTDGTFCIRTAYKSHRAISIDREDDAAVIKFSQKPIESQKWIISCNSECNLISDIQAINIVNNHLTESVEKVKFEKNDFYCVNISFNDNVNVASFAVSMCGKDVFIKDPKNGSFNKIDSSKI